MSAPRKGAIQLWGVSRPAIVQATLQQATLLPSGGGGPSPSAPVNLVAPSISGITEVGQVLTKTAGSWSGYPTPTVTWQWTKDGVAISGAIGNTYTIVSGDIGGVIGGVETATNGVGGNVTANSNNLGPVTNPAGGIQAPVLTKGSAAGVNPMSWTGSYPGSIQWDPATNSGDKMYMQWRVNGGAWVTTSAEQPLDAATLLSGQFNWPEFVAASASFTNGSFIEVEERKRRYSNNVLVDSSPFSNIISDTVVSGAWTPASYFTGTQAGAYYDISDISTLFQDTAGTVPVTAAGQAVARVNDKSGNGIHLTQATSTKRPIYRTTGGAGGTSPYLEFDGVDDILMSAIGTARADPNYLAGAIKLNSAAATEVVLDGMNNNHWLFTDVSGVSYWRLNATSSPLDWGVTPTATDKTIAGLFNGASSVIYQDGVAGTTQNPGTNSIQGFAMGGAHTDAVWMAGRVYAAIWVAAALPDATLKANITTWLGSKQGRTL